MRGRIGGVAVVLLGFGCGDAPPRTSEGDANSRRAALDSLTDRLAQSISRLDAAGAAEGVPRDSSVVYISDGSVIRGAEYVSVLESFYSSVDSLQFEWTQKEILFPTPHTAVVIGWASIRVKPESAEWVDAPAIFTLVYSVDNAGKWRYVTSQKTSVSP